MDTDWKTIDRPGYFGSKRDQKHREYDQKYGANNWRIVWNLGENVIQRDGMNMLYEDAYFFFLKANKAVLEDLCSTAYDVYDDNPTNVKSGLDYNIQETDRTHVQDIAIRRAVIRLGYSFRGDDLLQIRDSLGEHALSMTLSPGKVPFHMPEMLEIPEISGWWNPGSVESFYQSNKVLQVWKSKESE